MFSEADLRGDGHLAVGPGGSLNGSPAVTAPSQGCHTGSERGERDRAEGQGETRDTWGDRCGDVRE